MKLAQIPEGKWGLGLQDLLPGPESSRLGSHAAGEEGCWCCNPGGSQETSERKGLEVKSGCWSRKTQVQTQREGGPRVRTQVIGDPAKPLHCSWGLGVDLCSPETSLPPRGSSPLLPTEAT